MVPTVLLLALLALHGVRAQGSFAELVEALAMNLTDLHPSQALARLDLSPEVEAAINAQLNTELNVAHLYTGLWAYFSSDNINRPAVAAWYKSEAAEEREHAEQLMEHLNLRGGKVQLSTLTMPELDFSNPMKSHELEAMELTLAVEKANWGNLLNLAETAQAEADAFLHDWLMRGLIQTQAQSIRTIAGYVNDLQQKGDSDYLRESSSGAPAATAA